MSENPSFARDDEVTVTFTGRVVYASPDGAGVVVEYLKADGWPERVCVRPDAPAVSVVSAPAPDEDEKQRRTGAYQRMADSALDPDMVAAALAEMPYRTTPADATIEAR